MALQDNNIMLLDANGFPRIINPAADTIAIGVDTTFGQDLAVGGNLTVQGDIISGGTMDVVVSDNFIDLSNGQGNAANKAGGLTVNVKSSVARISLTGSVFTGTDTFTLPAPADPSTAGAGGGAIAAGDIIEIAGCTDLAGNNGLFVVASIVGGAGGTVTINSAPQVQSPWAQTAFENGTETDVGATIAGAVDLGVFCISDGALLDAGSNAIPVGQFVSAFDTAAKLSTIVYEAAANVSLQEAYNVGQNIVMADAQGNMEIRTDDTGARADFRLTNEGATADYLLTGAGLLTVGSGATNKVAMSGQLSTDLIFDGVAARKISQTGNNVRVETLTSGNIEVFSAGNNSIQGVDVVLTASGDMMAGVDVNDGNAHDVTLKSLNAGAGAGTLQLNADVLTSAVGGVATLGMGSLDINSAGIIAIDSGVASNLTMTAGGAAALTATAGSFTVAATAGLASVSSGGVNPASLLSPAGNIVVTGATGVAIDATIGGFSLDSAAGASNVTANAANLTVSTTASGTLFLDSAAIVSSTATSSTLVQAGTDMDLFAGAAMEVKSAGLMKIHSTGADLDIDASTNIAADAGGFINLTAGASSTFDVAGALILDGSTSVSALSAGTASLQGGTTATVTAVGGAMLVDHQHAGSALTIQSAATAGISGLVVNASAGGLDMSGAAQAKLSSAANVIVEAAAALSMEGVSSSFLQTTGAASTLTIESQGATGNLTVKANYAGGGIQVDGFLNMRADRAAGTSAYNADATGVTLGDAIIATDIGAGTILGKAANNGTSAVARVIGIAASTSAAGVPVMMHSVHGAITPTALTIASGDVGKEVFLGVGGGLTFTPPTASGSTVFRVGYAAAVTGGAVMFAPQFIAFRP
jgi:hypothetical protein